MPANKVHVFGIRHHGPGSAHSLLLALDALQPEILLIEGPPEAEAVLGWLGHEEMRPPVALLVYAVEDPHLAAYFPFAEFSPEWQAARFGLQVGIPVRMIDLPQRIQLARLARLDAQDRSGEAQGESWEDENPPPVVEPDPVAWAARVSGYSDPERWWEQQVEQASRQGSPPEAVFAALLELMAELRAETEGRMAAAGQGPNLVERQREAWMRQAVRYACREGFQRIAVVCGAWHAPVLAGLSAADSTLEELDAEAACLQGLEEIDVAAAWAPWSYGRLAWRSGYGAGIESPGWYEHLWQAHRSGQSQRETTIRWMAKVAQLFRQEDLESSPDAEIAAVRLAESLAALRGQSLPGLSELNEAVRTVFCFGDDLPLRLVSERLIIADRLGQAPEGIPNIPLQVDLARQQKRLRLPPQVEVSRIDLDLRKPLDLERSTLLHRLDLLEIAWGKPLAVSGKMGSFHELWQLHWYPELAVKVVEAGLWGNTVERAAAAFAIDRAGRAADLPALVELISKVLLSELPQAAGDLVARLNSQAALAADTGQLMEALPALAQLLRYGNVRGTDANAVQQAVEGFVIRICIGLPGACASLDDEAAGEMIERIDGVQRAVALLEQEELSQEWARTLRRLGGQAGLHGQVAGRVTRLLFDAGDFIVEEAVRRMGLALSLVNDPLQAAGWVEGFLRGSGALLVHDGRLRQVLDAWVSGLGEEAFLAALPLLRRTFATFSDAERRRLGELARQAPAPGAAAGLEDEDFDFERAEAVLPFLRQVLG